MTTPPYTMSAQEARQCFVDGNDHELSPDTCFQILAYFQPAIATQIVTNCRSLAQVVYALDRIVEAAPELSMARLVVKVVASKGYAVPIMAGLDAFCRERQKPTEVPECPPGKETPDNAVVVPPDINRAKGAVVTEKDPTALVSIDTVAGLPDVYLVVVRREAKLFNLVCDALTKLVENYACQYDTDHDGDCPRCAGKGCTLRPRISGMTPGVAFALEREGKVSICNLTDATRKLVVDTVCAEVAAWAGPDAQVRASIYQDLGLSSDGGPVKVEMEPPVIVPSTATIPLPVLPEAIPSPGDHYVYISHVDKDHPYFNRYPEEMAEGKPFYLSGLRFDNGGRCWCMGTHRIPDTHSVFAVRKDHPILSCFHVVSTAPVENIVVTAKVSGPAEPAGEEPDLVFDHQFANEMGDKIEAAATASGKEEGPGLPFGDLPAHDRACHKDENKLVWFNPLSTCWSLGQADALPLERRNLIQEGVFYEVTCDSVGGAIATTRCPSIQHAIAHARMAILSANREGKPLEGIYIQLCRVLPEPVEVDTEVRDFMRKAVEKRAETMERRELAQQLLDSGFENDPYIASQLQTLKDPIEHPDNHRKALLNLIVALVTNLVSPETTMLITDRLMKEFVSSDFTHKRRSEFDRLIDGVRRVMAAQPLGTQAHTDLLRLLTGHGFNGGQPTGEKDEHAAAGKHIQYPTDVVLSFTKSDKPAEPVKVTRSWQESASRGDYCNANHSPFLWKTVWTLAEAEALSEARKAYHDVRVSYQLISSNGSSLACLHTIGRVLERAGQMSCPDKLTIRLLWKGEPVNPPPVTRLGLVDLPPATESKVPVDPAGLPDFLKPKAAAPDSAHHAPPTEPGHPDNPVNLAPPDAPSSLKNRLYPLDRQTLILTHKALARATCARHVALSSSWQADAKAAVVGLEQFMLASGIHFAQPTTEDIVGEFVRTFRPHPISDTKEHLRQALVGIAQMPLLCGATETYLREAKKWVEHALDLLIAEAMENESRALKRRSSDQLDAVMKELEQAVIEWGKK